MTSIIKSQAWRPSGITDLERAASSALRHEGCGSVVAGPGSGKTEFLAQRSVYLLQTGICPFPRRVLAISFKSDAADNLANRVRARCPPELGTRFVSQTFDAFTKGLVDHFHAAIPSVWCPSRTYEIDFPTQRDTEDFLVATRLAAPPAWQTEIAALNAYDFEARHVGGYRLPLTITKPQSGTEFAIHRWWASRFPKGQTPMLTFVCLNRLAELLLRTRILILRALRATYPFVFVDEFQDTTYAQYDFLLSAFGHSQTAVTAVGDDKQRIMVWAGARPDSFARFQKDFGAARFELLCNFRSSPGLVAIQHVVARALDSATAPMISYAQQEVGGEVAQVWVSATLATEAHYLAQWIAHDIAQRGRAPRDYALLVRQRADQYEAELSPALESVGLRIQNESKRLGRTTLQDLLADEFTRIATALMRLGATPRAPEAWATVSAAVEALSQALPGDQAALRKRDDALAKFVEGLRVSMSESAPAAGSARVLAERVFEFLDLPAVKRTYPQYAGNDLLAIMTEAFYMHWQSCADEATDWLGCLEAFEGVSRVPLLTVHKSKGLEYDTIIFVGLDDRAWWSHVPGNPEGLATFFVALSRAKQRAVFAFCQERGQRAKVAELYQLLQSAGVAEVVL